jgi:hypothetical protein
MKGIENKLLCLKLNRHWQVIDQFNVGKALVDLAGGKNSYALDIDYVISEEGLVDFSQPLQIRPVEWEEWITLPIREWDFSIKTIRMEIRIPTILIVKNYGKVPEVKFGKNPSTEQIRIRDGNRCQYTGRKLKKDQISIDHVRPKSRGGDNSWENLVCSDKNLNTIKSNKTPEEAGLKLIRLPEKPNPIPRYKLIHEAKHIDWNLFLKIEESTTPRLKPSGFPSSKKDELIHSGYNSKTSGRTGTFPDSRS